MESNFGDCVKFAKTMCIIVPCHLQKASDIKTLIECLWTVTRQVIPVNVYLVITFNPIAKTIFNKLFYENKDLAIQEKMNKIQNHLTIIEQSSFTSILNTINFAINHDDIGQYQFVMFCKDHDLYDKNRTISFIQEITKNPENRYLCTYEQKGNKKNNEHITGFWQYCIGKVVLHNFFDTIEKTNGHEFIDHPHGFLVLATYLLVVNRTFEFGVITKQLYEERKSLFINTQEMSSFDILKYKIFDESSIGADDKYITDMINAEGGNMKQNSIAYYKHIMAFNNRFYN